MRPAAGWDGPPDAHSIGVRSFGEPRLRAALQSLLLAEQVAPMRAPALAPFPEGACSLPLAHNRRALAQEPAEGASVVLASPALGAGLVLSPEEAAALRRFLAEGDPEFRRARAPKLQQLGVLAAEGASHSQR